MRNIYKISVLACALILSAGFVACGGDSGTSAKDDESSSSIVDESSSSKNSSSSIATNSSSSRNDGAESSSSVVESSSGAVLPADIKADGYYKTNCPEGKACTYAPTEHLNPEIAYGEFLDTRDYQVYKTVTIGTQTWMAQNLNYADSATTTSLKGRSWCYNNVADSCAKYGRLYTSAAAIDSVTLAKDADNPQTCGYGKECDRLSAEALAANPMQGVCPSGWHLPSYDEWDALRIAVGGLSTGGKALKSVSGWYGKGVGTDAYGFSALPAGRRNSDGYFNYAGSSAYFWSASQNEGYIRSAYSMGLYYHREGADLGNGAEDYGLSIRCIKD